VRKTADESVTNSTTLQNDDDLALSVGANEVWEFEAFVLTTSASGTPDLRMTFDAPSGSTISWQAVARDSTDAFSHPLVTASGTTISPAINAGTTSLVRVRGVLAVGSTAGTLRLQWAQNTADADAVTISANSFLKAGKF
jgi:hypothetical protein